MGGGKERAVSPVVGVALLIAIVLAIVGIAGIWFVGFQSEVGDSPRAAVDVEYDPGFSLHTHSVAFSTEATDNTDELLVKSPRTNACSGEKQLGGAGTTVRFELCSPGDRFVVVAKADSTTTVVREFTIPEAR